MKKEIIEVHNDKENTFDSKTFLSYLDKEVVFEKLEIFDEIDSTNKYAKTIVDEQKARLIIAKQQTAGHGRNNRHFHSPDSGLYFSLLFYPKLDVDKMQYITIIAAVAVVEAIELVTKQQVIPKVKWLNDIYFNNKKICGILAEGRIINNRYEYIILGIGINLYETIIPKDLADKITSIETETNIVVNKEKLLATILNKFYVYYEALLQDNLTFMEKYRDSNFLIGKTVYLPDESIPFQVTGINNLGHLEIVRDGIKESLKAGEVSLHGFKTNEG